MKLALRCQQDRQPDGSYRLSPEPLLAPRVTPAPFLVSGSLARFWETLVEIAARPPEEQESLLADLPPRTLRTLAKLELASVLEVAQHRDTGLSLPLDKLHLEITNRCNFACRACYLGGALRPAHGATAFAEADTAQWEAVVREAAELGCAETVVTGGEPLLRRDLLPIVAALQRHSIRCVVNTNASCVTDAMASGLLDLGVWAVYVTLYGFDDPSAARYTGVRGGHSAALNGIRRLVEHGVYVRAKFFAAEGPQGYDIIQRELAPLGVEVVLNTEIVHGDVFTGRQPPPEAQGPTAREEFVQETSLPCAPGKTCLHIGPAGEARPCTKLGGVTLGNVFTDGLTTVWHSAATEDFRRYWVQHCSDAGFVRGARVRTTCPASQILARPSGIAEFNARWRAWRERVAS